MKLSGIEKSYLEPIMGALIPPGHDQYPLSALDTGAVDIFKEMLLYLPLITGLGLRVALAMIEFAGPLLGLGRAARFSGLSLDDREKCLVSLSKKDTYIVRQLVLLVKSVACLAWCGDKRVRAALGHDLPPKFVKRDA